MGGQLTTAIICKLVQVTNDVIQTRTHFLCSNTKLTRATRFKLVNTYTNRYTVHVENFQVAQLKYQKVSTTKSTTYVRQMQ